MKRRSVCALLIAALLLSLLALPVSAANTAAAKTALIDYAKSGYYNEKGNNWWRSAPLNDDTGYFFEVSYSVGDDTIYLYVGDNDVFTFLKLTSALTTPYEAGIYYYGSQAHGETKVDPTGFTGSSNLSFQSYSGAASDKLKMTAEFNEGLKDLVECVNLIFSDKNLTLKDLHFDKFTRHTIHYYTEAKVTKPATCVADGVFTYTCKICGYKLNETIPATGVHSWDSSWVSVPATCTDNGVMGFECSGCGQRRYEVIPAIGHHSWDSSWVSVPATCTENGVTGFQCSVCGEKRYEVLPAPGHDWQMVALLSEATEVHGSGSFRCSRCELEETKELCISEAFADVPAFDHWAHPGIDWAVYNNVTNGTSETAFEPEETCTRAQVVTFLWRAAGRPQPQSSETPFDDVAEDAYYTEAVLWAVEKGITVGTDEGTFSPDEGCTRAQVVTFLWRFEGMPDPIPQQTDRPKQPSEPGEQETSPVGFEDVAEDTYYAAPVAWAVRAGITNGTDEGIFSPDDTCTREQIVTFLYRDVCRE